MKKLKMTKVVWRDATSTDEWTDYKDIEPELHEIETVGHLYKETTDAIIVALSHDPKGEACSSYISIPLAWIVSRDDLQIKRKRKPKCSS